MSILDTLFSFFGSKNNSQQVLHNTIYRVGRYTDNNKNTEQLDAWKNAETHFQNKEYIQSVQSFFTYVSDVQEHNVDITSYNTDEIVYAMLQGSKKIQGTYSTKNGLDAYVKIGVMHTPILPVMRKLLNQNYVLFHTKYAIQQNTIYMQLHIAPEACSPNKLWNTDCYTTSFRMACRSHLLGL